MDDKFKRRLKNIRLVNRLWCSYRRFQHDRLIENEQRAYEERALQEGIPVKEEPIAKTYKRLQGRLASRGLVWPPEPKGRPLHIIFCTPFSRILEQDSIAQELLRIGRVTSYYVDQRLGDQQFDSKKYRHYVDSDLPSFVQRVHAQSPVDMMLSYLPGSCISAHTVHAINFIGIPTFFFHLDDRLSFRGSKIGDQWSGPADVCSAYDLNLTNAPLSIVKYRVEGGIALFWPQAADKDLCRPKELPFEYDVSFIGAKYGRRPLLIDYLRKNAVEVECFGPGWENGPLTPEQMIDVYSKSRINLGSGYIAYSSYQCIKGRDFEVPMCGTVYLTSHHDDLSRLYRIGEEIETYADREECLRKILGLLADPERCDRIRLAARKACLERHTRETRVRALLECKPSVPWAKV